MRFVECARHSPPLPYASLSIVASHSAEMFSRAGSKRWRSFIIETKLVVIGRLHVSRTRIGNRLEVGCDGCSKEQQEVTID